MKTEISEIADGIYRLSTFVPAVGPTGFTFNQFLIDAEQPLLFHYGQRSLFPLIADAVKRVIVETVAHVGPRLPEDLHLLLGEVDVHLRGHRHRPRRLLVPQSGHREREPRAGTTGKRHGRIGQR